MVFKLWRAHSRVRTVASGGDSLKKVIRIIVDSGLLYTISVVAFLLTIVTHSNAIYGVTDAMVQIIVSFPESSL